MLNNLGQVTISKTTALTKSNKLNPSWTTIQKMTLKPTRWSKFSRRQNQRHGVHVHLFHQTACPLKTALSLPFRCFSDTNLWPDRAPRFLWVRTLPRRNRKVCPRWSCRWLLAEIRHWLPWSDWSCLSLQLHIGFWLCIGRHHLSQNLGLPRWNGHHCLI